MNQHHSSISPGASRLAVRLSTLVIGLGSLAVLTAGAGAAVVDISNAVFGKGKEIHLTSGMTTIPAAPSYDYAVTGTVHGTGLLAAVIPNGTPIATLIDKIKAGSSSTLAGTQLNPNDTLPFAVLNKTYAGSFALGPSTASGTLTIKGKVTAAGVIKFDVINVDFTVPGLGDLGTVVFETGSKLTVNATAVLGFTTLTTSVKENAGPVVLTVKRKFNTTGVATVAYESIPGTATSADYTPVPAGSTLQFADGDASKTITIPITNRSGTQGSRSFKVKLSSPTNGVLNPFKKKEVVTITDAP